MTDRIISDEEKRLREVYKRQNEDIDRSFTRMGSVAYENLDLLSEIWRFLHSDGPFLPETKTQLLGKLGYLNHELCRSRDYINMRKREAEPTQIALRAEIDRSRGKAGK